MSKKSTRELIGLQSVTGFSLQTSHAGLVFFLIKPTNITVLSAANIAGKVQALLSVLKGLAEVELMCLNSKENFDANKAYLQSRMEEEFNPVIRKLLEQDSKRLDQMQIHTATAREFVMVIRLKPDTDEDVFPHLSRVEKAIKEAGFTVKRADKADLMRILSVYFEQNVTTEQYEDFDGQRWLREELTM